MNNKNIDADDPAYNAYRKEFDLAYARMYEVTSEVAHKVAQEIFEKWSKKSYDAFLDIDSQGARAIAERIAENVADSIAEDLALEAYSKVYEQS